MDSVCDGVHLLYDLFLYLSVSLTHTRTHAHTHMRAHTHTHTHGRTQVDYSCDQWLMKNMDPLNDNVVSLLSNSTDPFVHTLWKDSTNIVSLYAKDDSAPQSKFGAHKPRKGMFRTVGQLYKVRRYIVEGRT